MTQTSSKTYQLVSSGSPILRTPTVLFDFINPPLDPQQLAEDMIAVMSEHKGIGLAANQVGLPYRMFVLLGSPYAIFNPKVVWQSEDYTLEPESCLSFPGLVVKVKRPKEIRVRYQNINGGTETQKFQNMTAKCIMHEIEHLDGKLFYNSANRVHREVAMRRWRNSR
jgi:peptide deformylase